MGGETRVLEHALRYGSLGLKLVPLRGQKKIPIIKNWQAEPLISESEIKRFFTQNPNCNLGVLLGECALGTVLGVDFEPEKSTAHEALKRFPRTVTSKSRLGFHVYLKLPSGRKIEEINFESVATIYASNRQFVLPPSVVSFLNSGELATPHEYKWLADAGGELSFFECPLADAPDWMFFETEAAEEEEPITEGKKRRGRPVGSTKKYKDGERHLMFEKTAVAMRKKGHTKEEIYEELLRRNREDCIPPKENPEEEIEKIVSWTMEKVEVDSETGGDKKKKKGVNYYELSCQFMDETGLNSEEGARVRHYLDDWYIYNRTKYDIIDDKRAESDINCWLIGTGKEKLAGTAAVDKILQLLRVGDRYIDKKYETPVWIENGELKTVKHLLPLRNGLMDLKHYAKTREVKLLAHTPKFFSRFSLAFDFDEKASCPTYDKIAMMTFESEEKKLLWEEIMGIHLFHPFTLEYFFVLQGEGGNGKSVLINILTSLLGEENVSSVPLQSFRADHFSFYTTFGKLANIVTDQKEIENVDEGLLKQFVSREPMTFNRKFKDPIIARPTAFLTICCNTMPRIADKSDGVWRRLVLFKLKQQIEAADQDRRYVTKGFWEQSGELPGILNKALAGLSRVMERGRLPELSVMEAEKAEFRTELNSVAQFVEACLEFDSLGYLKEPRSSVYRGYKRWTQEHGMKPFACPQFVKLLEMECRKRGHSIRVGMTRIDNYTGIGFSGLRLNSEGRGYSAQNNYPNTINSGSLI